MRVSLLLTGSELMTGDIVDSNSAMIAQLCLEQGIQIADKSTIPDELGLIESEIERLSQNADVLIVNGGLGPTSDDLTAEALANVLGLPLEEHALAMAHLREWCSARDYELSASNRKQAYLPKGIELLANSVGSAPGFKACYNNCWIFCTPGVPHELKLMLEAEILPQLKLSLPEGLSPKRVRYRVFGYGESRLQQLLKQHFEDWPDYLSLGFRASIPLLELKLMVEKSEYHHSLNVWAEKVESLLGDHIVTQDDRSMAHVVVDLLRAQGKKITFAESCTGGKIASLITEISGASEVFEAGVVSYSNTIKQQVLKVSARDLNEQGAVSEIVAQQMLQGALSLSGADLGVSVSGIAGPGGGTETKPVGLVCLAWGSLEKMQTRSFYFPGSRVFFQHMVSALALDLVRRELIVSTQEPEYFNSRRMKSGT